MIASFRFCRDKVIDNATLESAICIIDNTMGWISHFISVRLTIPTRKIHPL